MQLDSQTKQQYLAEMGIDAWYPRVVLVNAQPAVSLLPEISPAPDIPRKEPNATPSTTPAPVLPATARTPDESQSAAPVSRDAVQQKPVRFGLGIYVVGSWIVTSSLVPDHARYNEADIWLILSILKAIDGTNEAVNYHHIVSWPFFSNPQASQGIEAAQQYVNGVLEHLREAHPNVRQLLSLGGVMAKLNGWDTAEGDEFQLKRLNLPSVYKMLEDGNQKKRAWQLIQQSRLFRH